MNIQKIIVFGSVILLLLIFLVSYMRDNMSLKKPVTNFSELIGRENLNNLNLTIYFMSPYILTRRPVSESDLMERLHEYKVTISGEQLEEYSALLAQLSNLDLLPIKTGSVIDVRMLYVFETREGEELLRVSMWGANNSMFVNGEEVEENPIFYDIIIPFISADMANTLQKYIDRN